MNRPVRIVLVCALGVSGAVAGGVPEPGNSTVMPWDVYGSAFVTPGNPFEIDLGGVIVHVIDSDLQPVPFVDVEIDISDYAGLCIDPVDPDLTAVTDDEGVAILYPQVGGCNDCWVIVRAAGVTGGQYQGIKSTDWNGHEADGKVELQDFTFFTIAFRVTQDSCADYNGDGVVNGTDFAMFAASFRQLDENPNGCE